MPDYDVVVIGAGNGGITASCALAQKGLSVLLLERHNIPGGCGTSFCRGRFEFEIALHQLSGVGTNEKPGPLRLALQSLGVFDDIDWVQMDDLYTVHMPDGFQVVLKADADQVKDELKSKFPHEAAGIDKFMDMIFEYSAQFLGFFVFRDYEGAAEKYPLLLKNALKAGHGHR